MPKPVPERLAAKAAGERFYSTGKPCRNGHMSKRYTGTGICAMCSVKNTLASQKRAPEHPARIAAREAGEIHYSTGVPCVHGHDRRLVSNGICVDCHISRTAAYHERNPGLGAKWARERRAKDPTGHRKASIKWAKNNPEKTKVIVKRMIARDPEGWRKKWLAYVHNRNAKKRANGGSFTAADIDRLYAQQDGKCAACGQKHKLEVDHIIAVAKGGGNDPSNLQLLCSKCNKSKGSKDYDEWIVQQESTS